MPERALLVDDDDGVRLTIARLLREHGFVTDTVASGKAALRELRAQSYDIAFIDIFMPEMDGIEVIRSARRICPDLPIVAISGGSNNFAPDDFLAIALKLGADRAMLKPFSRDQLREALEVARPGSRRSGEGGDP